MLISVRLLGSAGVNDLPTAVDILASASTLSIGWLRMQVPSKSDVAGLLDRLVAHELPSGSGLETWDSFLRAYATLMRRLEVDLAQATGLALARSTSRRRMRVAYARRNE